MIPPDEKTPEDRFEEAWRRWVRRPPRHSQAEAAARVGSMIRARRRRRPVWAYAAAAVLMVAVAVAVNWSRLAHRPAPAMSTASIQESPQLGQGEVLMWLDKDTPLYMTFQPPEGSEAKGGKP